MMEEAAAPQRGTSLRRALVLMAWGILVFLALRFITRDALRYFTFDEAIFGRFWPRRISLVAHITGGILALLLGPFQFWSGLRRYALSVHSWTGRLYLSGVAAAAGTACYLVFFIPSSDGGWPASVALFTLASAWLTASGMALVSIRKGLIDIHKEWMIRSYVLTFAFVTLRWWSEFPVISSAGTATERIVTMSWLGWVLPLFVTEVVLHWTRMRHHRPLRSTAAAAWESVQPETPASHILNPS